MPSLLGAAMAAPRRRASTTAAMVAGSTHGMSASAISHAAATGAARTPQARLAPMPSAACGQRVTRPPHATNAAASGSSCGRTTATTESTTAARCFSAATPMGVPSGSSASSFPPPKRDALPAASKTPTIGPRMVELLRQQAEPAVLHRHQHPGTFIHAVVIGGTHVEHALAADDVALLLDGVAQGDPERLGPRLRDLQRRRNRALQYQSGVVGIGAESCRLLSELLLVGSDVGPC